MKMRMMGVMFLVSALIFAGAAAVAHADDYGKKGDKGWDLEDKVFDKAHFLLSNKEELGLSDEQVKKIKDLKTKTRKDTIRTDAEIDVLAVDIKTAMWEDTIDVNAVNALIDKKYDLKKEKAKSLLAAYVALKSVLTDEQKAKMKDIKKKCEMRGMKGGMMEGKMEGMMEGPQKGAKR